MWLFKLLNVQTFLPGVRLPASDSYWVETVAKATANISSLCILHVPPSAYSEAYFLLNELFSYLDMWMPNVSALFAAKLL